MPDFYILVLEAPITVNYYKFTKTENAFSAISAYETDNTKNNGSKCTNNNKKLGF